MYSVEDVLSVNDCVHVPPTAAGSATPGTSRSTKASLKKRLFGSNIKFQHKSLKS